MAKNINDRDNNIKGIAVGEGSYTYTIGITVNDGDTYWGTDLEVEEAKELVERLNRRIKEIENQ